jgi:hypothetical protein
MFYVPEREMMLRQTRSSGCFELMQILRLSPYGNRPWDNNRASVTINTKQIAEITSLAALAYNWWTEIEREIQRVNQSETVSSRLTSALDHKDYPFCPSSTNNGYATRTL